MSVVVVSGYSDDMIELDGDINDEFSTFSSSDEKGYISFSNGVVIRVEYTDEGIWRIFPVAGNNMVSIHHCNEADAEDYTDIAIIAGPVTWAVYGTQFVR